MKWRLRKFRRKIKAGDGFAALRALVTPHHTETRVLAENVTRNGVADRLEVHGAALASSVPAVLGDRRPDVVLCDIEGSEFTQFSDQLLEHLHKSCVVIELHGQLLAGEPSCKFDLITRASRHFCVVLLTSSVPDVFAYLEQVPFDDDHRLLALSEGRDAATEWLVLRSKADTQQ